MTADPDVEQRGRREVRRAETRARVLAAARELIPAAETSVPVTAIARHAGVAIQTIYDQFGSKGGLVIAVIDDIQRSEGLFAMFGEVFRSPDGAEAMRRMIAATVGFWHRAWPYVEFMLRARRIDPVVAREMVFIDRLRRAHFLAIVTRIGDERRIRAGQTIEWATDQAFALTTATVYEELVVRGSGTVESAIHAITTATFGAILEPGTSPVLDPPPDWVALETSAAERAKAQGADPAALSANWRTAGA